MQQLFSAISFVYGRITGKTVPLLLMLVNVMVFSQMSDVPYDFPVKPGTPAWAELKSHDAMLNACHIPDSILKNMSTDALAKTCLDYPLYIDMMVYSTYNYGIEQVIKQFNGLQELVGRKDAGTPLAAIYSDTSIAQYDSMILISYFELLLSIDTVLENLTNAEKFTLMEAIVRKYLKRRVQPEVYGPPSLTPSGFLLGKLLKYTNTNLSSEVMTFLEMGEALMDLETLDSICSLAVAKIAQNSSGAAIQPRKNQSTVTSTTDFVYDCQHRSIFVKNWQPGVSHYICEIYSVNGKRITSFIPVPVGNGFSVPSRIVLPAGRYVIDLQEEGGGRRLLLGAVVVY